MNHTRKYVIVFLLGIIGFFAFFIPVKNFAEQKKPICKNCNVILITLDVLGSNHLPCYGYERNTTPNLCKFAEDNVFFTRSYSQNSLTLQSTFSLFTSLYADTHKITTAYENTELDNKYKTLPEVLQNNEYDSIFYGLLNFDPVPLTRGIERGFSATVKTLNLVENLPIWKDSYKVLLKNTEKNKPTFLYFYSGGSTISYLVREKENFFFEDDYFNNISSIFENAQKFSPDFFQFLMKSLEDRINMSKTIESKNYTISLYQKLKNAKNIKEAEENFKTFSEKEKISFLFQYLLQKIDIKDKKQMEYLKTFYDENIFMLDKKLGDFLSFFKENKEIADNTIIVITSQHGEEFMEHGAFTHGYNLYNTTTSVPLIFSIPNVKNRKIDELVQNIDVYPTILGLLGLKPTSPLQGKDLSDLIYQIPNAEKNEYVISEDGGGFLRSIQEKDWKLYVRKNGILELYDTKTDSGEYTNVLLQYPHIAGRMLDALNNVSPSQYEEKKEYNFPPWIDEIKKQKIIKEGYF